MMMLHHMGLNSYADKITKAIMDTLAEGKTITGDLGGTATNSEYAKAIISKLK
jgi:isocitrate dehydrogenase (NAD+)